MLHCPRCTSHKIAVMSYGYAYQPLEAKHVYNAGCCVGPENFICTDCEHPWVQEAAPFSSVDITWVEHEPDGDKHYHYQNHGLVQWDAERSELSCTVREAEGKDVDIDLIILMTALTFEMDIYDDTYAFTDFKIDDRGRAIFRFEDEDESIVFTLS